MYTERKDIEQLKVLDFQARLLGIKNTDAIKWNITRDRVENFLRLSGYMNSKEYKDSTKQMNIPPYLKEFLDEFYRDGIGNRAITFRKLQKLEPIKLNSEERIDWTTFAKAIKGKQKELREQLIKRKETEGCNQTSLATIAVDQVELSSKVTTFEKHDDYIKKIFDDNINFIRYHMDIGDVSNAFVYRNKFQRANNNDKSFWVHQSYSSFRGNTNSLNSEIEKLLQLQACGKIQTCGELVNKTSGKKVAIPKFDVSDLFMPTDDLQYIVKFQKVFYAITKTVENDSDAIMQLVHAEFEDTRQVREAESAFESIIVSLYRYNEDLLKDFGYDIFIEYISNQAMLHHDLNKNALKIIDTSCKINKINLKSGGIDKLFKRIKQSTSNNIPFQDIGTLQILIELQTIKIDNRGLLVSTVDLSILTKKDWLNAQAALALERYERYGIDKKNQTVGIVKMSEIFNNKDLFIKLDTLLDKQNDQEFTWLIPVIVYTDDYTVKYDQQLSSLIYFLLYSRQRDTEAWRCLVS